MGRRVRYRRTNLGDMSAVEMVSDSASSCAFHWSREANVGAGERLTLECPPSSRITYDLTLPSPARVLCLCAVAGDDVLGGIEFELRVSNGGTERLSRQALTSRAKWLGRRWYALQADAPAAGSTRVSLVTRPIAGAGSTCAMWRDPCVETARPLSELWSAARDALSERGLRGLWHRVLPPDASRLYALWIRSNEVHPQALRTQREASATWQRSFTLITFVAQPAIWSAKATATSLISQSFPRWEWIIVAPEGATEAKSPNGLPRDSRVRVISVPAGTARADAWNVALRASNADYIAVLDPGDVLSPSSLYDIAESLEGQLSDVLYSDEDVLGPDARRCAPQFKPDWSPELLLSRNYVGRLCVFRRSLLEQCDGFRASYPGLEEWELLLRLSRMGARIARVAKCLYHRAVNTAEKADSRSAMLREHCAELGLRTTVSESQGPTRVSWSVERKPRIHPPPSETGTQHPSSPRVFAGCSWKRAIQTKSSSSSTTDPANLRFWNCIVRSKRMASDRSFRSTSRSIIQLRESRCGRRARRVVALSQQRHRGAAPADWLDELAGWGQRPDVGVVGAKLLYPTARFSTPASSLTRTRRTRVLAGD